MQILSIIPLILTLMINVIIASNPSATNMATPRKNLETALKSLGNSSVTVLLSKKSSLVQQTLQSPTNPAQKGSIPIKEPSKSTNSSLQSKPLQPQSSPSTQVSNQTQIKEITNWINDASKSSLLEDKDLKNLMERFANLPIVCST